MNYRKNVSVILLLILSLFLTGCQKQTESAEPADSLPVTEINTVEYISQETVQARPDPTSEPEEAEPEQLPEEPETVTVCMVGDVLLHDRVEDSARREDGSYNFDALFENTKDVIRGADLAIVNQEVILGGTELKVSGYPNFNGPTEVMDALAETGFDVVCHGTNHALDRGGKGLLNCLNSWQEKYPEIEITGIHDSAEDQSRISVVSVKGLDIAVLNYTYGTNGISLPGDMPYAVDYLQESRVKEDLAKAREQADIVIVCPHWGTEYRLTPDNSQKKWAQLFADNGADLILGTHPHVPEPVEVITATDGREVPVYYSLGNYVNWTSGTGDGTANRMVGEMAYVTFSSEGNLESCEVLPLVSHVTSGEDGVTVFFLKDYSEEKAAENEIRKQDPAFSYDYCRNLCENVLGEYYEPETFRESGT